MRCLSTERVHLSALCTPPQPDHHTPPLHDLHKDSAITEDSRLTSEPLTSSPPTAPSPITNMYAASQGPSSVGLAMKLTRSDSALTQSDHRRLPDFHQLDTALTSSLGTQWPAVSLPALGGSIEGSQRKPLFRGFTSTCSLGESSGSDSSRTSTAKNPYSSGSSLSTVPDDSPSWEVSKASHAATSKTAPCTAGEVQDSSAAQGEVSTSEGGVSLMVPVPPTARPPPHASTGCQPHVSGPARGDSPPGVVLPERYRHVLRKTGSYSNVGGFGSKVGGGQDLTSREKDLGSALAWIRHEMVQMKEQDKILLKRFIELRASILQLRCMHDVLGSTSDLSAMDGSSVSLNELRKSPRVRSMVRADSDVMMSGSMYVATSSLSLPCSPQLSRLRWRSDDLM